jgi:hypothetical protein
MKMGFFSKRVLPMDGGPLEALGSGAHKPAAGEGDPMVMEQRA